MRKQNPGLDFDPSDMAAASLCGLGSPQRPSSVLPRLGSTALLVQYLPPGAPFLPPTAPWPSLPGTRLILLPTLGSNPFTPIFWCAHGAALHTPLPAGRRAPSGEAAHLFNFVSLVPDIYKTLDSICWMNEPPLTCCSTTHLAQHSA